eukprot:Gb_02506 [translate_table: standard]
MEHVFTSSYLSSAQMSVKDDDNVNKRLSNAMRTSKFDLPNQQEIDDHASLDDHFEPSGSGALMTRSAKDLPEAILSLRSHSADDANVATGLEVSPGKCTQTVEVNTKVKELCYTDIGFPRAFVSDPESIVEITPLVSSSSGGLSEVWKKGTCARPFLGYSNAQSEQLSSRKNKQKFFYDETSKDQIKQGHVRSIQNGGGHWRHLYQLAASAGNSKEATGQSFKMPSSRGCNFDLQEQSGTRQNEQGCHAKVMQDYSETPKKLKLNVGISQNSSDNKQILQGSQESVYISGCNRSYRSPSLTSKSVTQMTDGIRTKILSASGISQVCVKDSLNDNRGVAARQNGISLRQWFGRASRMVDKIESLHIFKQILELVEHAHSQGVVLQNIRPSCFVLSSLNRVTHVESSASQMSSGLSKNPMSTFALRADCSVKIHQNKKRSRQLLVREEVHTHGFGDRLQSSIQKIKPAARESRHSEQQQIGEDAHFQKQDSGSSVRSSSEYQCAGQAREICSGDCRTAGAADGKLLSKGTHQSGCELNERQQPLADQSGWQRQSSLEAFNGDDHHSVKSALLSEENWYTSPEELNDGTCTFASDIYSLGVLLFELFCTFASWDEQMRVMSDLRHRILPPRFLSEHPKEAGFCLWLLHPEPSSRPKAREVVQSELLKEDLDAFGERQAAVSVDEEDAESELLLDFLLCLQKQKQERARKLDQDVSCLTSDIQEVERRRSFVVSGGPVTIIQSDIALPNKGTVAGDTGTNSQRCVDDDKEKTKLDEILAEKESSVAGAQPRVLHLEEIPSGPHALTSKGARLMENFKHLEQVYFAMRGKIEPPIVDGTDASSQGQKIQDICSSINLLTRDANEPRDIRNDNVDRLGCFFDSICKYARYGRFEVRATLRHGDLLNTANVVCSVSFDRDQEFFATAGVSKKIKVFGCDAVLNANVDIHYPAVEMISKSKLSSVCWNSYIKSHIASTDYDGVVQLWDASTGQRFAQYDEHQKRAWSVDFAQADPTKLASGSDDCTVKLWSINQEGSIATIKTVANVCCVQFPPDSAHMITFGSADYKVYCYDLRNTKLPWCTLTSHGKAVSYVKFIDASTIVSASTDNTLKLWDLTKTSSGEGSNNACTLTFTGHTNEKNFVGLSVSEGYIACGSETNSVFAYYKSLPMPMASHKFGSVDPISGQETEDDSGQFVSSVCWRGKSKILVAANSTGNIKLLEMV